MHNDTLFVGEEAREKLFSGFRKAAQAVGATMGTGGSNGVIEAIENPGYLLTNDGWSLLNAMRFADPIEEIGRKMLVEAVNRANKGSGDGSSTTTVLTNAIIGEGKSFLKETSPMELKRSLEACVPLIEESINKQKREIAVDEVGQVAAISAEDPEIGARIQEIYQQIGKDGIIHWDISKTAEDSYTIGSGITVEGAKYYSPYMCDADESGNSTGQIRLANPKVLLTKQKIVSASEFNELAQALHNKSITDLVVFADEIEPLVVPDLIKTRALRGFRIILVKMPTIYKDVWYEDLALASGAKTVDAAGGFPMKHAKIEDLGTFGNITITKDDTYIDGVQDLASHIENLKAEGSDDSLIRAARLNTKTARYYVGAQSDAALSYRRLKVEDAISAAYQALHGGIVAGGGAALVKVAKDLSYPPLEVELETGSVQHRSTAGVAILKNALEAPMRTILTNAGIPENKIDAYALSDNTAMDTRSGKIVDMFEAQITDPAPVVLNAVKNAISVAAAALTANTVITFPRVDNLGEAFSRQMSSMMQPQ